MSNNTIKLLNAAGLEREYSEIPDLWHIAMAVEDDNISSLNTEQLKMASKAILDTWHMAHDLKDAISADRKALILEIK